MKSLRSAFAIVLLAAACTRTPSPTPTVAAAAPASTNIIFVEPDPPAASIVPNATTDAIDATRSGSDIYAAFEDGLAEPGCEDGASTRWRAHYANATQRLANARDDAMPLFGYVVDAMRAENLPTEYALIPFVESRYHPEARSDGGPAGLWQMIALTARRQGVSIRNGYDGRLSPVESTRAAVRYLKLLDRTFAGNWRLVAMAYNAGEGAVLGAIRRSGHGVRDADAGALTGLSPITLAYARKLQALSCLLQEAHARAAWQDAIDRPVPLLVDVRLPAGSGSLDAWATRHGLDANALRRMNPAFPRGVLGGRIPDLLTPAIAATGKPPVRAFLPRTAPVVRDNGWSRRVHVVVAGESLADIAHRNGLSTRALATRNGLEADDTVRPGMVLDIGRE
ncbi:LysM peptidoglycan-binding domain-containing protein [Pseudoluteimonas lycopersici]|uniref:LysM peptidoglycan-binding domain-containing protein n=1 Tax=Pseudoluteimonas lycopersici TaxID=1324796 RepID=A0A516V226_9GAMM|nr:lytic transglycosylase domain-containing protein [Lysobacter lycopersici]QDQ72589.1 LysM peptidoglycan-binding domain-containing protein [Lysobacter lycopersici]